jgi:hypothetical protein
MFEIAYFLAFNFKVCFALMITPHLIILVCSPTALYSIGLSASVRRAIDIFSLAIQM